MGEEPFLERFYATAPDRSVVRETFKALAERAGSDRRDRREPGGGRSQRSVG